MDVQMPVMDGYEATRKIRSSSHPAAGKIPIIAMTANAFAEDIRDALEAGMDAHAAKPIGMSALERTVRAVLEEKTAGALIQNKRNIPDRGSGMFFYTDRPPRIRPAPRARLSLLTGSGNACKIHLSGEGSP